MDWKEDYRSRFISPEEAAGRVKAEDRVAFTIGRETYAIGLALVARVAELKGVRILAPTPGYDFGWYNPGWEELFDVCVMMPSAVCQQAVDERRCDIVVPPPHMNPYQPHEFVGADVLFTEISPPDERGFCSFGQSLWDKKRHVRSAKTVIAEVNPRLIRTFGDNFIRYSEIDYFVEHVSSGAVLGSGTLAGREARDPDPFLKDVAGYVNGLLKDGDTIQIGVGRTTEPLVRLGLLENRHDIGYYSEATPPGVITLVKEGVINGRRKTLLPEKAVVTSLGGGTADEMQWANMNPAFWLVDSDFLEDVRVISQNHNMVAINTALAVDLLGQSTAEGLGHRIYASAGGQIAFVFGALHSPGGRVIHVLPSTVKTGKGISSRIVPHFPPGTPVTIQRNCTQFIVTEYGIADLLCKTQRQRAEALIGVAHPDFRAELRQAARQRFWPS
jgi:4-hydroxybutyrate CoA-transferase